MLASQRQELEGGELTAQERLLLVVSEQIKTPLLQIARRAELANDFGHPGAALRQIEVTADRALKFIDSFLLSSQLLASQQALALEPVSLSSVLSDTAQILQSQAHEFGCELELRLAGRYGPVMAHRDGLQTALTNLGMIFIEAASQQNKSKAPIVFAAHASKTGIVAGVFSDIEGINRDTLKRAREMQGRARQPLSSALASGGAGIFVADSILKSMSAQLHAARHNKLSGLAATFLPSQQLVLV